MMSWLGVRFPLISIEKDVDIAVLIVLPSIYKKVGNGQVVLSVIKNTYRREAENEKTDWYRIG